VVQTGVFGSGDALPQELNEVGWDRLNAHLVREYERYAWPSKVFSGAIKSYMVPIKPEDARVLLGYEESQARLFEMHPRAAAARENTYYMAPRSFVEAPARIIWRVSGGGVLGGVRAMSWLDEVDTGGPHRLFRKHRDSGVLDKPQVLGSAKPSGDSGDILLPLAKVDSSLTLGYWLTLVRTCSNPIKPAMSRIASSTLPMPPAERRT